MSELLPLVPAAAMGFIVAVIGFAAIWKERHPRAGR
jgi:hypothetical protein